MFHIQQYIQIGSIKIESINNSSMLQIGTSGGVNAISHNHPLIQSYYPGVEGEIYEPTLVPLPNPN